MTIHTVLKQKQEMYNSVCDTLYHTLDDDSYDAAVSMAEDLLEAMIDPLKLAQVMQDGSSAPYLGNDMEEIEDLQANGTPFVLVVMDGEKVYATINGDGINF